MSGFLHEVATPCPRRSRGSITGDESGTNSLWDDSLGNYDDTGKIDFTTEIRAPTLTGAKPKRRTKTGASFAIHSDHDEKPAPARAALKQKRDVKPAIATSNRKTSLLAQPAQRFRPRVSFAPSPLKHSQQRDDVEPKKRNTRPDIQKNNELLRQISGDGDENPTRDALKKDVRRNTVYIPSEDTTVASVFMGLFSPLKSKNLGPQTSENTEIGSLELKISRKRQAKRSLASPPDCVPLQPSLRISQESCNQVDIPGRNGGKENIPPGMVLVDKKGINTQTTKIDGSVSDKPVPSKVACERPGRILPSANTVSKPLAARSPNRPVQKRKVDSNVILKASVSSIVDGERSADTRTKDFSGRSSTLSNPLRGSRPAMSSSISRNSMRRLNHEYPLVPEKITSPSMYDDNWLSHQEVILSQLINGLFDHTNGGTPVDDPIRLRQELLLLYQGPYLTNLYKRLQASLMYGALSIPKDVLAKASRLRQDLGMKRKFIDIWLKTYEPKALRAALETVTGRIFPNGKMSSSNFQRPADEAALYKEKALARRLENFLDAFLVQNQDMNQNAGEFSDDRVDRDVLAALYRRTVLRSIMLVILLDKAKKCPTSSLSCCLFLASSPYKSSLAVLQALARFLLPSCGDVSKAIAQLDCQLLYEQRPLEEYDYGISNLAVDLRDGVRLTRIVELLLYPSVSRVSDPSNTPRSTSLSQYVSDDQWPLSRHLKFPCLGRAVKVFNVKVALNALAATKEGRQLIGNVRGADIVDGHREKTIALLWGLVSNWGLSGLVDMDDLRKEIGQLRQKAVSLGYDIKSIRVSLDETNEGDKPAALLNQWASLLTQLRGLHPGVSTTNLGSGRVYECILDEYEGYILDTEQISISTGGKVPLEDRLRALGCSTQFINIVSPKSEPHILDTHSTTGALAFLCSRLLIATKHVRAATLLQNAWRRVLHHREAQKRIMARDVARQCAAVVQTRDRILWAKGVIVHWWRLNRASRQRRITTAAAKPNTKAKTLKRKSTKIPLLRGKHI
ncbi:hypothetical protein BDV12DRAFT_168395 [Aspergillus spectabilis]